MQFTATILFWSSLAALFVTKAADVITTVRHVGVRGESNPLARALFARLGFAGGLAVVCALFTVLTVGQYLLVWWLCGPVGLLANSALGFLVAWFQWDAARFNSTGRHSWFTALALRAITTWGQRKRRPR